MFVSAISILARGAAAAFRKTTKASSTHRGGQSQISLDIDEEPLKLFMKVAPKVLNQEFNRGLKNTMGVFTRRFSAQAFGKGKIEIRRKGKFKRGSKGGVFIPLPMKKFGFIGLLRGVNRLDGKRAEVRNSARFAQSHEYGATIVPKRGKFLIIRLDKRGALAKARRAGVKIPRGKKPKILKVKKVVIKPRLGFHRTFHQFRWTAITRMNKTLARAARRAIQLANRAKAKKK